MSAENFDAVMLARHIANLRRLGTLHLRRWYFTELERREGKETTDSVKAAFVADWEKRKVKE